jgi:hypothetical protein
VVAPALHTAGAFAPVRGQDDQAAIHFTGALTMSDVDADNFYYNVEGLALVAARSGQPERALRLLATAAAARAAHGTVPDLWWARLVAAARAEAGQQVTRAPATHPHQGRPADAGPDRCLGRKRNRLGLLRRSEWSTSRAATSRCHRAVSRAFSGRSVGTHLEPPQRSG